MRGGEKEDSPFKAAIRKDEENEIHTVPERWGGELACEGRTQESHLRLKGKGERNKKIV